MKIVVMAGGTGTRFWPMSRIYYPKQFAKYRGDSSSLFQSTLRNIISSVASEDVYIVTNIEYKYFVLGQLEEANISIPAENIIYEPDFSNTLNAVSIAVHELSKVSNEDERIFIIPSNNTMTDNVNITIKNIVNLSLDSDTITTFTVNPNEVNSSYGYIRLGDKVGNNYSVVKFIEKPRKEISSSLIDDGYLYNSGVYSFTIGVYMDILRQLEPKLLESLESGLIDEIYNTYRDATVEYALLEKSSKLSAVKLDIKLKSDGFINNSMHRKDSNNNVFFNDDIFIDSKNNFIYSDTDKSIGVIGVNDLFVIDQPDALLVCNKGSRDSIGKIAEILKIKGDQRAYYHTTCYRPWGSYTVLENGVGYKIKRITVYTDRKLSYQSHTKRSEHWVVVSGIATVTKDGKEYEILAGESTFIPMGEKHRLHNKQKELLELIEVQIGGYLEEDDIVRYDDDYGR